LPTKILLTTRQSQLRAHEQDDDRRDERDREQRGDRDGRNFRERERLEEPPFLRLKREDWRERDGDDEQRKETRRPDFFGRADDHVFEMARPAA
jgi:hypothetical protein